MKKIKNIFYRSSTESSRIVYCGECSHKMVVQYKTGTRYLCNQLRQLYGVPVCQYIPADPIDEAVVKAFFEVLSPIELDMYARAMSDKKQQDDNLNRAQLQQIERLRYQARLAERQFNQVDPDNRLVCAELERRWECALNELKQAEIEFEQKNNEERPLLLIAQKIKQAFQNIGRKMPEVWQQNILSQEQKKALLRSLIDKIVIHRTTKDIVNTRIVWKGGDTTTIQIPIAVGSFANLSFAAEAEKLIIQLAQENKKDSEIADLLTEKGFYSPKKKFMLVSTVQRIRLQNGIHYQERRSYPRSIPGYLTISQLTKILDLPVRWIHDRIRLGKIAVNPVKIEKYKNKLYLFPDNEDTIKSFTDFKNGVIDKLNFFMEYQDE